jgi:hypothetical protein
MGDKRDKPNSQMGGRKSLSHDIIGSKLLHMGGLIMSEIPEGLISGIFKGTPLSGLGISPKMLERDLIIEMTEQQFKDMVFSGMKEPDKSRAMQSIDIKINEGKITIKVRLF